MLLLLFRMFTQDTPKVTMGIILLQIILFINCTRHLDYSLIPFNVISNLQIYRLVTNHLLHTNDLYMYFNMIALLSRGSIFERRVGSRKYLTFLVSVGILSSMFYTAGAYLIHIEGSYRYFLYKPVIGFSGILFWLKAYMDRQMNYQIILGYRVLSKYVVFMELLLMSLLQPSVSFLGHLFGIFAGCE